MDKTMELVEQHILASASRLKHIDELMAKAREATRRAPPGGEAQAQLGRFETERNRLAGELDALRRMPRHESATAVERSEGLKGVLERIGLELEQAVTAVLETGKH